MVALLTRVTLWFVCCFVLLLFVVGYFGLLFWSDCLVLGLGEPSVLDVALFVFDLELLVFTTLLL